MVKQLVEVEGIVFKRKRYQESSVLLKMLTKEYGIISVIVKGALKNKSKLGGATLNFSYGTYVINTNFKGISNLRAFKNTNQFDNLYLDVIKNASAAYLLDLISHAFIEYENVGKFYGLILEALKAIDLGKDPQIITQLVQLQLLEAYGVKPNFEECVICHKRQGKFDYSLELGGIICSDHFEKVSQRMNLPAKLVSLLRTLMLVDIKRIGKINIDPYLKKQTQGVIDRIYQNYLDLNLKSKKVLQELEVF
ncbi:DNA repair protein RecO [Lactobacillus sp. PV012]|uniref:DNA repair protein RecO n=1 Tax=Lactobacillus sp. PV012 TaxID=2594494 RepID=UPI0022402D1A|nr:DNA repair protein RecO [Lactobacillus sp. PV012]QNQ82180.1 DNA repair protein RecO [Lactobacillus sp. PV012]